MSAFKGIDECAIEMLGNRCASCDSKVGREGSGVWHSFNLHERNSARNEYKPFNLVLCAHCAPVIVARLAADCVRILAKRDIPKALGQYGYTDRSYLYPKKEVHAERFSGSLGKMDYLPNFTEDHVAYINAFVDLMNAVKKEGDEYIKEEKERKLRSKQKAM